MSLCIGSFHPQHCTRLRETYSHLCWINLTVLWFAHYPHLGKKTYVSFVMVKSDCTHCTTFRQVSPNDPHIYDHPMYAYRYRYRYRYRYIDIDIDVDVDIDIDIFYMLNYDLQISSSHTITTSFLTFLTLLDKAKLMQTSPPGERDAGNVGELVG